ncbi:hypothetical protein I3760_06G119700 [Carya illinoinensis]|uniref:Uncharacterized protein n=1 Tax=Carya illinoinensis TaxID=32201 RepID=A0A922ET99_CARIL|nr:hypothetical protein I3760_06G119700 [Carya illinoinensis]KAG2703064.1 hypothetical protein I3760_06G119700 [Carya illinoinensis]KAG6709169.1 hypothetical protein I3842_06G118600 [Carya illinoinensis]
MGSKGFLKQKTIGPHRLEFTTLLSKRWLSSAAVLGLLIAEATSHPFLFAFSEILAVPSVLGVNRVAAGGKRLYVCVLRVAVDEHRT